MLLTKQLVATAAVAALAIAAPPPYNAPQLAKRSFTAKSHGRAHLAPFDDIARTHRKYGYGAHVSQLNARPEPAAAPSSGSIEPPAPFSTSSPASVPVTPPSYDSIAISVGTAISSAVDPTLTLTLPGYGDQAPTPTPYGTTIYTNSSSVVQTATSTASEDGEATTVPEANEAEYLTTVTVGGQKLQMDFDTGSSDLWVYSPLLSAQQIGDHSIFNPNKSSTFELLAGATWNISYGDGSSASGVVGYDTVDIGGATVAKQAVELASRMDNFQNDPNSDGLLGLSFSIINTVKPVKQKTFFDNVMPDLSHPVFTADLQETDGTGTYEFGNIDPAKYTGEVHYVPVNSSSGFWEFPVPSYQIGDKVHNCSDCGPMIADTGTTLIYLDTALVNAYYAQVKSVQYNFFQGAWLYDCNETLPDLGVNIGGYMATIQGADMKYAEQDGLCVAGVQEGPGGFQIMGDVFLKRFFAVFDGGEKRFGIATKD